MNCGKAGTRLGRYLDGELPPAEKSAIAEHLAQCGLCAGRLQELRGIDILLRSAAPPLVPSRLAQGILQRARAEEISQPWPWALRLAAAGTALAAMYLGFVAGGAGSPRLPAGELGWLRPAWQEPLAAVYQGTWR